MAEPLVIAGEEIAPGSRADLRIPVAPRTTQSEVYLPARVIHGRRPGPRLFVCAAIHGDEINGVEIIRRLLRRPVLSRLRGALLAVPIVNVYGFVGHARNLPDRRDLNRSFPGSAHGSMASRLAHRFVSEVVEKSSHGIDLHTGAIHRANLPQIRACLDDDETQRLARAFGAPVVLDADVRDGSLRQEVLERDIPMLVYEGGEALRFDEMAIRAGVAGVLSVMRALGMLPASRAERSAREPFVARSSHWVRAPESGILRTRAALGARVKEGDLLGVISDPLGDEETPVPAPYSGVVIGRSNLPLVHAGDALFHVATFDRPGAARRVASWVASFQDELSDDEDPGDT
jgi:predicted deacylase